MNYKKTAEITYLKFSEIEGNQNIAGDYALEFILRLIKDFKIKNVLEIGLGIGSVSDAIMMYAKNNGLQITYTGTEANQYCIEVLPKNVNYFNEINLLRCSDNYL